MPTKGTPDVSFSRKLIESFVAEDSVATNLAGTAAEPAAAPAAGGAGGPILLQYANYLGMDVVADSDLLWIAQQALTAELPPGWTEHADAMSGDNYCATPASRVSCHCCYHISIATDCVWRQITTQALVRLSGSTRAMPTTETCTPS